MIVMGSRYLDTARLGAGHPRAKTITSVHVRSVDANEGADWLPFSSFGVTKATAGKGRSGVSREAVWFGGGS